MLLEAGASVQEDRRITSELEVYLAEPLTSFHQREAVEWWQVNNLQFPQLANTANQFLSAPPTSVASERLFLMLVLYILIEDVTWLQNVQKCYF